MAIKLDGTLSRKLNFRVTPSQLGKIRAAAEANGFRSPHQFARHRTLAAARDLDGSAEPSAATAPLNEALGLAVQSNAGDVRKLWFELQRSSRHARRLIRHLEERSEQTSADLAQAIAECRSVAAEMTRLGHRIRPVVRALEESRRG